MTGVMPRMDALLEAAKSAFGIKPSEYAILMSSKPNVTNPTSRDRLYLCVLGKPFRDRRSLMISGVRVTLHCTGHPPEPVDFSLNHYRDDLLNIGSSVSHGLIIPSPPQIAHARWVAQTQGVVMVTVADPLTLVAWVFSKGWFVNGAREVPKWCGGMRVKVETIPSHFLFKELPCADPSLSELATPPLSVRQLRTGESLRTCVHTNCLGVHECCLPAFTAVMTTQWQHVRGHMGRRGDDVWCVFARTNPHMAVDIVCKGDWVKDELGRGFCRLAAKCGKYVAGPIAAR